MGNRFGSRSSKESQRTMVQDATGSRLSLLPWLYRVIGIPHVRLQVRLRGNNLYLLCESPSGPSRSMVLELLIRGLAQTPLEELLPANQASVYQVIVYGRSVGQKRPQWAEVIHVTQIERYLENLDKRPEDVTTGAIVLANLSLAKRGNPGAIARYLSEELSAIGVAVRANVKSVALPEETELPQTANLASVLSSSEVLTPQALLNRLWVVCESAYSPDASMMAASIAQNLRDLELTGFRDALVFSRVQGEANPDWVLRVDLTPPNEMLKEWARWGDVEALARLLNMALKEQKVEVSATLLDITLHITCQRPEAPEKERVLAAIAPLLETIAPQGIHAATVYGIAGQSNSRLSIPDAPDWIQWIDLPGGDYPALSDSTRKLAQQGDLPAIAYLLTRLLNPDLDTQLATGGTRIQVRQKEDLLHIMTDAPVCPPQNRVGSQVAKFIQHLNLPEIQGVRVYGRRAGQNRPLWSYGVDFLQRERYVPEATPEFAASDAYVGDLLTTEPGDIAVRPDLTAEDIQAAGNRVVEAIQRVLARSTIFVVETPTGTLASPRPGKSTVPHEAKVALVWGTLGILLTVQADWALGHIIKSRPSPPKPTASASPTEPVQSLPQLSLQKNPSLGGLTFNGSGFTQSGQAIVSSLGSEGATPKALVASPLKPKAAVDSSRSPYPTFNAKQLDEKLVLYRQYVAQSGAPDVLIVGSSRAMRGIDPVVLEQALAAQGYPGSKVFNFGVNGATAQVVDLIVRRILPAEKMPKLILLADGLRAFNSGRTDATFNAIASSPGFRKLPNATIESEAASISPTQALAKPLETISRTNTIVSDHYQSFNEELLKQLGQLSRIYSDRNQLQTVLKAKLASEFGSPSTPDGEETIVQDGQGLIDINGFLPISNRFNPATYYQKYARVPGNSDADYENFTLEGAQTEALRSLAQFTKSQNIPLVIINLPLTEVYLDSFRRDREQEFQQYLMRMSTEFGFTYRDLLENWKTENDFFSDPSHLNRYGGYAVSNHIAKDPLIPWQKRN